MALTNFYCPYCKEALGVRGGLASKMEDLGPEVVPCPKCGHNIRTGAVEWVDMSDGDKTWLFVKVFGVNAVVVGPLLSFLAGGCLIAYLHTSKMVGIVAGCAVWLLLLWQTIRTYRLDIAESLARKPR